jgi:hypothetical protein
MQRLMDKDLDVGRAREIIATTRKVGMGATVSLISGFPEETFQDLRNNVDMYLFSLRHPRVNPQFNILAALAGTPIHSQYRDQLTLDELCSDVGHQGRSQNELDRELIRTYPEIFPNFYLLPTPYIDRDFLLELREFLLMGRGRLRWLFVALDLHTSGVIDMFTAWRDNRNRRIPNLTGWNLRLYYMRDIARMDFVHFVRDHFGTAIPPAVECLVTVYEEADKVRETDCQLARPQVGHAVRPPGVFVLRLDWDVRSVIQRLGRGDPVNTVDRTVRYFRTAMGDENSELIESTPFIYLALLLCDGSKTLSEVTEELAARITGLDSLRKCAAAFVIEALRSDGLIQMYENFSVAENHVESLSSPPASVLR